MITHELTQNAAKVITETAEDVLGKTPKKAKKQWISNETMQLIERKRQLRNQRKSSAEYNDLKRDVQNALRKDKQERLEEKCTEAEEMNRKHNTTLCLKKNPCDYIFGDNLNSKRPIAIIFGTVIT